MLLSISENFVFVLSFNLSTRGFLESLDSDRGFNEDEVVDIGGVSADAGLVVRCPTCDICCSVVVLSASLDLQGRKLCCLL